MGNNGKDGGNSDDGGKDEVEFKVRGEEAEKNDKTSKVGGNENARWSFD